MNERKGNNVQITIASTKATKNSIVLIAGGKEYFAKKGQGIDQSLTGSTIEVETKDSDYNGKTYTWVEKWKPVAAATQTPPAGTNGGGSPSTSAPWWMPFVSNITAHAIQAGIIQTPQQIEAWAIAARNAAHKLDTDIPY